MRRAHIGRMLGAAGVATLTLGGLSACFIPPPPPVPQPPNADPIVQGSADAADVREGFIPSGGTTEVELQIDERAAVVVGVASRDEQDLTLRLTGEGVDVENDDSFGDLGGLAFELGEQDPLLGAIVDPGTYAIEVAEYGGGSSAFQLQVLTGSTTLDAGDSIDVVLEPGQPVAAIVTLSTGSETVGALAGFDSTLWALVPAADASYADDDSGGDRNPRLTFVGEEPQDIVVVASGYSGEESGPLELSVQ